MYPVSRCLGGQDSGKERAENCVALSESRNNGGLRFREVKRNPISSLPRRREGLPVERTEVGKATVKEMRGERRTRRGGGGGRRDGGGERSITVETACREGPLSRVLPLFLSFVLPKLLRGKKREREYEGDR